MELEQETLKLLISPALQLIVKPLIDTYISPKLNELKTKYGREKELFEHGLSNKLIDYLGNNYEKNLYVSNLALRRGRVSLDDVYVPLTICYQDDSTKILIDDYKDEIFKDSNKIIITDKAGMGKSTLMRKLYISIIKANIGVPILIELRRLNSQIDIVSHIIDQLTPINETIERSFILDLIRRGDFIFLLDGYDEISLSEREKVSVDLESFLTKANVNKFIITSRPQENLSSFSTFSQYHIQELAIDESFNLIKKYDPNGEISELLIKKIKEHDIMSSIEEYLKTPLLVTLLYLAFEYKQKIPFNKHLFYRQVFDALFEKHDLSKGGSFEREKQSKLNSDEFHRVMRVFGFLCLRHSKIEFSKDELNKLLQESIDHCSDLQVSPSDLIKDLTTSVPLFSNDGIYFRWSHKSLQEYFASQYILMDTKEEQCKYLQYICFHQNNITFLNIIDLYYSMDPIGFERFVVYELLKRFVKHCDETYNHKGYKEYNRQSIHRRQQIAFGHELILIKYKYDSIKGAHVKIFFLIENYRRSKGALNFWGPTIRINPLHQEKISYIKVPIVPNLYHTLIVFLASKGKKYIAHPKWEDIDEFTINLDLPYDEIVEVVDDIKLEFNSVEKFDVLNKILIAFLCESRLNDDLPLIDKDLALEEMNRIESLEKMKATNNLLDF